MCVFLIAKFLLFYYLLSNFTTDGYGLFYVVQVATADSDRLLVDYFG